MLVSAIVTTHNRRELCKRALESVFSQTYPDIECILVDDASDEGPNPEWEHESRIRYIYIPKSESKGGNHARNLGIVASSGKYVAFLDDDDYWLPEKTSRMVEFAQSNGAEYVYCGMYHEVINTDGSYQIIEWPADSAGYGDMSKRIFGKTYAMSSQIMVARDLLLRIGCFDENLNFWQDLELNIRLAQETPFFLINDLLVTYRVDKSDTFKKSNRYWDWKESVKYIYRKHSALFNSLPLKEKINAKMYIHIDAKKRCKSSNLKIAGAYNHLAYDFWKIKKKIYHRILHLF